MTIWSPFSNHRDQLKCIENSRKSEKDEFFVFVYWGTCPQSWRSWQINSDNDWLWKWCKMYFSPFQCKHCGKAFASHAAHDSHVRRTHTKDRACMGCDLCGKTFTTPGELKMHMTMHHGMYPFCKHRCLNSKTCFWFVCRRCSRRLLTLLDNWINIYGNMWSHMFPRNNVQF